MTSVPRVLVDIAGVVDDERLMRACHEAQVLYGITPDHIEHVLERRPASRGARRLRRVVHGDVELTLSKLERTFVRLVRDRGLPVPTTNKRVGARIVDCRWPEHHLTVELDSYQYHSSRWAWERDHRREREARARGDDFRRFTYGNVIEHPAAMLRELTAFFASCPILVRQDRTQMGRLQR